MDVESKVRGILSNLLNGGGIPPFFKLGHSGNFDSVGLVEYIPNEFTIDSGVTEDKPLVYPRCA